MATGKVYLVGAGPGDPKLITVRGLEALRKSDAVVYDRLAAPQLLREVPPHARLYYVGKRPERHATKQEDINRLLVELALEGLTVTRLKGGDPFVFGRGGEEAEALARHGIPFEIVPGVTSAVAVPAYAGIPVTHRDAASSFLVLTGHEHPDKLDSAVRWDKAAGAAGTIVVLMGVANLDHICRRLMEHGRPPDTPVALVRWGTRAEQRTLEGTLGDIARKVKEADFKPPAVIVIGETVRWRKELQWFERKPLFGRRVLVTRAKGQAGELSARIDELGGEPYEYPVIETRLPESEDKREAIRAALARAETYDWIIFTSVNGVDYFFRWLGMCGTDMRRFHRARVAAVGPKTAEELKSRGIVPDTVPGKLFQAEGLFDEMKEHVRPGMRALLPRGDLARDWLPEELARLGVEAVEIDVYETVPAAPRDDRLVEWLEQGRIHMVTFTSSSTVHNLIAALEKLGATDPAGLLRKADIACIGAVTAETAAAYGLDVGVIANPSTIDGLVKAIVDYYANAKR